MRVLVTGGAGYLGAALVGRLARQDDIEEVVIYDNLSRGEQAVFLAGGMPGRTRPVRLVQADLLDTRRLARALDGIDVVYHLAARVTTPFAHGDIHGYDQVNRWGTAELGHLLEAGDMSVQRLVNVSSAAVYGDMADAASLDTPPAPVSAYGVSKWQGERLLERLAGRLDLCQVRCANVYGHGVAMRFDAVVNRLLFEAHFGGRMTLNGSGEQRRSFVHVDSAAAVLDVLGRGSLGAGVFHLVERTETVLDVARAVGAIYPDVESLFISQHLRLPDSVIAMDPRVPTSLLETRPMREVLRDTAARFAF